MSDFEQWDRWRTWGERQRLSQQEGAREAYYDYKERHGETLETKETFREHYAHTQAFCPKCDGDLFGSENEQECAVCGWQEPPLERSKETMETKADIVRTVIGHHVEPELDLTVLDDPTDQGVSLIQHDRDQTDLILLSYAQMENLVQWWRKNHES